MITLVIITISTIINLYLLTIVIVCILHIIVILHSLPSQQAIVQTTVSCNRTNAT